MTDRSPSRDADRDAASGTDETSARDACERGEPDAEASELSRCPRCGTPVAMLTICGPMDARVAPCGCRLAVADVNELTDSSS
ncbi:hypothetical protein [Halovivax gelatinilyticus]|uniref:hypothetical protein n=1 Tax=Halovivax gelatinilyticus TaxID=2961597 RepID=UPI0020CA911A|nr:hypothetical protein [Halovivax gelatinilyticus]